MYPVIKIQGVLILTCLVANVHTYTYSDPAHGYGPDRPVIIRFGHISANPVRSALPVTGGTPQKYPTNNQNQFPNQYSSFQVTVTTSKPAQKKCFSSPQNSPPTPKTPLPLQQGISTSTTASAPTQTENTEKASKTLQSSETAGIGGVKGNSGGKNKVTETASSLESDKGFGYSSIMTYNIGSFQGLKLVSNNKISNQNNGVNNSPGSNLDNFIVNNLNESTDADGIQGPDDQSTNPSQIQNNGLNKSGTSRIEGFVVNNNNS